jgi:hypothetical protein
MLLINKRHLDNDVLQNKFKDINKNAYFLCHGGLGDLFCNSSAVRFLSYFYNKIFLFCPVSSVKNLQILFNDVNNIEFITYNKWYTTLNTANITETVWPSTSSESIDIISKILQPKCKNIYLFNLFDWKVYVTIYSDLHLINNKEDAWNHWINFGKNEGRIFNKLELNIDLDNFDWQQYRNNYSDLSFITNKEEAWNHWILWGKNEGRTYIKPDTDINYDTFNWEQYKNNYSDLQFITDKEGAWDHWIRWGKNEGRRDFKLNIDIDNEFSIFDWDQYRNNYLDLSFITNKQDAWDHWIRWGKNEGRKYSIKPNILYKEGDDIFVNGFAFDMITSNRITHSKLLNYCQNNLKKNNCDDTYYYWIKKFYEQINLDLTVYYNYFHISSTKESLELYTCIKSFKLVFLHFISSCGQSYLPDSEWPHIYKDQYLIIDPDKNHYDANNSPIKYDLANKYLALLSINYIDIILNATDIYVCDSSFAHLIYPLRIKNRLCADNVIIYDRYYPYSAPNIPVPVNLSKK